MDKININEKFSLFSDHWNPRVVAALNGQEVRLAKLKGEFVMHAHELEDELFFVVKGTLRLVFKEGEVALQEGEMMVVPRGVEHQPIADEEVWVMLFEPKSTINTGNAGGDRQNENLNKYESCLACSWQISGE